MTPGGRLSAAIEILDEVLARHRPATDAIRDWGRTRRFAGSADRAAINALVNAALRRRQSIAWLMGGETPRALALGALGLSWHQSPDEIAAACDGGRFAPPPLSEAERARLAGPGVADTAPPDHVRGDYPEWLTPAFAATFAERAPDEGQGLAGRAPLDLRVNTLKAGRDQVADALSRFHVRPTRLSPHGLRIALDEGPGRVANVESHALHGRGRFEVQDEGSQVAALLAGARPGMQVVDYCAGAGGKTLALAAAMENRGQIYAHDADRRRLRPIFERLRRAGARNVQVLDGAGGLAGLEARADLVLVDAPCTGTGVWRRRPDAKWRLTDRALGERVAEQREVLADAARLVRSGGRLAYVTCSVLEPENNHQIQEFMSKNGDFSVVSWQDAWADVLPGEPPASASPVAETLLLTPALNATDGFFVALLRRR